MSSSKKNTTKKTRYYDKNAIPDVEKSERFGKGDMFKKPDLHTGRAWYPSSDDKIHDALL